jgi:hypothetical protein
VFSASATPCYSFYFLQYPDVLRGYESASSLTLLSAAVLQTIRHLRSIHLPWILLVSEFVSRGKLNGALLALISPPTVDDVPSLDRDITVADQIELTGHGQRSVVDGEPLLLDVKNSKSMVRLIVDALFFMAQLVLSSTLFIACSFDNEIPVRDNPRGAV